MRTRRRPPTGPCVFCAGEIDPADGATCDGCGNPAHDACAARVVARGNRRCAECGADLSRQAARRERSEADAPSASDPGMVTHGRYAGVPWYRREDTNLLFLGLTFVGCLPLSPITIVVLLTGDIYRNERGPDGGFVTWGTTSRVWAVCAALLWSFVLASLLWTHVIDG